MKRCCATAGLVITVLIALKRALSHQARGFFLTSLVWLDLLTPPGLGFFAIVISSALSLSIAKASFTLEVELLVIRQI
jgi:hypothetical protein